MVTHYIITNRQIIRDAAGNEIINNDGREHPGYGLRFAFYTFDPTGQLPDSVELLPDISDGHEIRYNEATYATPGSARGSQKFFLRLYESMISEPEGDLLLYIHGFNSDFDSAKQTIRDLHKTYVDVEPRLIKQIVMFTWPAMHQLLEYWDDSRDAQDSGVALARVYQKLLRFYLDFFGPSPQRPLNQPCRNNIHLMCHSMGAQVLESAVQTLIGLGKIKSLFREIILVAPDVDNDAFEDQHPLNRLVDMGGRITSYFNVNDKAMLAAVSTKHFRNRLGFTGPRNDNLVPMNVNFVDVSFAYGPGMSLGDEIVDHNYHLSNPAVVTDITQVLRGVPGGEITGRMFINYKNIFRIELSQHF